MAGDNLEMTDLVFELQGESVPLDYPTALWSALVERLPWLASAPGAGVHSLRTVSGGNGRALLSRRSRLVLRVPASKAATTSALHGQVIELGEGRLVLGAARERPITPWPTIHATFVASDSVDETSFDSEIRAAVAAFGARVRLICGRLHSRALGARTTQGAGVVLHDLDPELSLRLQYRGLGPLRQYGCGIIVPHKIISGIY